MLVDLRGSAFEVEVADSGSGMRKSAHFDG
jgi:hypothetical protein